MKKKSIVIAALCVSSLGLCVGSARSEFQDGSILRSLPSGNVAADSAYHVNKDAERKEIEQLKANRQKRKEELKEKKQKRSEKRREKKELRKLKKQERKQKREDALRLKKEQAETKAENAVEGVTENPGAAKVEAAAEAPAEIIPEPPAEKSEEPTYREKLNSVLQDIEAEKQPHDKDEQTLKADTEEQKPQPKMKKRHRGNKNRVHKKDVKNSAENAVKESVAPNTQNPVEPAKEPTYREKLNALVSEVEAEETDKKDAVEEILQKEADLKAKQADNDPKPEQPAVAGPAPEKVPEPKPETPVEQPAEVNAEKQPEPTYLEKLRSVVKDIEGEKLVKDEKKEEAVKQEINAAEPEKDTAPKPKKDAEKPVKPEVKAPAKPTPKVEALVENDAEKPAESTYREKLDAVMKEIGAENQLKKTDNEAALKQEAKKTADTKEAPIAVSKPESKEPVKAATQLAPETASKPSETVKDVVANPEPVQTENTPSETQEGGKLSSWQKISNDLRSLTASNEPKPEQEAAKQNEMKEEFLKKEAAKQSSKKEIYTMPQAPAKKGVNVEIRQNGQ